MKRTPIATRYTALVVALLSVALVGSGALELWVSHRDRETALMVLQQEKAQASAQAVSRFIEDARRSLDWVTLAELPDGAAALQQRRLEVLKLMRQQPALTTVALLDARGSERLRVSRIEPDRLGSGIDRSAEPGFAIAHAGETHYGEVIFAQQTEPYVTIAAPGVARDRQVALAEVNLKFVADVVSAIEVGATGYAYVVDARGRLVSHRDLSRVLQMSEVSALPQVRDARGTPAGFHPDGRDARGRAVLAAHAAIPALGWTVFVEQPRAEALAPLVHSTVRTLLIVAVALLLTIGAGVLAARHLVAPVGALRRGAERFGAGDLAHRIDVQSGDELQDLAARFNAMAAQLSETYADLERRVAERTRELDHANQAKSRFLAAASHDLRQPMHALALFVGQLRDARNATEAAALAQRIEQAVSHLSRLLDQLLDLSKLDAGAVQAVQEDFAWADTVTTIHAQCAPLALAKGIELRLRGQRLWLRSDPVLVQRILLNLVGNAIRCTGAGGVLIGAKRRGERVRIAVWDTGPGIPRERHDDVFREFVQLEHTEPSSGGGLGLGLAIVARLARLLGTRIELRSCVGRGSMFAFELPRGTPRAPPTLPIAADLRGTFALVIDDDESA
ncbi:MAG TPA: sensor histidine kinase, partial [Burkholderiaceae bacterium]|nr:sensor histidine kinase [Burkholderiaceae bacterium]